MLLGCLSSCPAPSLAAAAAACHAGRTSVAVRRLRPWASSSSRVATCRAPSSACQVLPGTAPAAATMAENMDTEDAPQPSQLRLTLTPVRFTKTLHLIRHGEGFHNVAGHANHDLYKSEEYFDAHLTELGWQQAEALGRHLRTVGIRPELVVTSPLTRALETAVGVFGRPRQPDGASHIGNGNGSVAPAAPLLMREQAAKPGTCAARPAAPSDGCPKFVAHELCREIIGVHPCDRRRPTADYRATFPAVDFSLVTDEDDKQWQADVRESRESVRDRGVKFLAWLATRPEHSIAVVTHSTFLHFMLAAFGTHDSPVVQGELHRWYENCEMRTVVLADGGAAAAPQDPLHFPGGARAASP